MQPPAIVKKRDWRGRMCHIHLQHYVPAADPGPEPDDDDDDGDDEGDDSERDEEFEDALWPVLSEHILQQGYDFWQQADNQGEQQESGEIHHGSTRSRTNRSKRPTQRSKSALAKRKPNLSTPPKMASTPSRLQPPRSAKAQSVTPTRPSYSTTRSQPSPRRNPPRNARQEHQDSESEAPRKPTQTRQRNQRQLNMQAIDRPAKSKDTPQATPPMFQVRRNTTQTPKWGRKAKSKTSTRQTQPLVKCAVQ